MRGSFVIIAFLLINYYPSCNSKHGMLNLNSYFGKAKYYAMQYPRDHIFNSLWKSLEPFYQHGVNNRSFELLLRVLKKWYRNNQKRATGMRV